MAELRRTRLTTVVVAGCGALGVSMLLSAVVGASALGIGGIVRDTLHSLGIGTSPLSELEHSVLWQLRLPRVVLGALVGACLSLGGAGYQGAFRNPLVDPYLLGSAAGAGLGATIAIAYGPSTAGWPLDPLPLAAFVGAIGAVLVSYGVATAAARAADRGSASYDPTTLVLAGVAVASFLTALQSFVQQRHSDTLRSVYSWILGGLVTSGWHEVRVVAPYLAVGSMVVLAHRRYLDVLAVGDDEARSLGVDPQKVRTAVVAAASLMTAAAVSVSGLVGFVGLVVPHVVRLVFGARARVVMIGSLLFGAAFVVLADLVARTVTSPAELPLGVVTAFVGAPFFAWLLVRRGAR